MGTAAVGANLTWIFWQRSNEGERHDEETQATTAEEAEAVLMRCTYCGSGCHTILNCSKTWSGLRNRAMMRCTYCGKTDHRIEACRKTHGGRRDSSTEDFYVKDK